MVSCFLATEQSLFEEFESPGQALRYLLEQNGWTQDEFAEISGTSRQTVAQLLADRSGVSPEMATVLSAASGMTAAYWLKLDSAYRLAQVKKAPVDVERRAKIYTLAPIRDMQKRGWIRDTKNLEEMEQDLKQFFGTPNLDSVPQFPVATRRFNAQLLHLTASQRAWCYRAKSLADALKVSGFRSDAETLRALTSKVRELAAYPKEGRHLPSVLAQYGVRFVVLESLPGAKIDGATFWLDEHSPVIAVSVRYDRIDNFWFTLMHELSHVRHGDALSVDIDIETDEADPDARQRIDGTEQRANIEASAYLIPTSDLESFIRRVSPLYSRDRIIQFAHTMKIHPGIIIGQLQHRGELHSSANRELLSKIRGIITETALTDGWGKTVSQDALN